MGRPASVNAAQRADLAATQQELAHKQQAKAAAVLEARKPCL